MVHLFRSIRSSFVEHQSRHQFDSGLSVRKKSGHKNFSFILKANSIREEEERESHKLFADRKAVLAEKQSLSDYFC